ncbi:MAG: hypothetical protein CFE40_05200 [Burkholderiales bacterium PBB1]|nr:MAG: hypothetical protein CFE40_05200 [Burkholderiales bacterium PBB1]
MCTLHIYHAAMHLIAHTVNTVFQPKGECTVARARRAGPEPTDGLFWLCAGLGLLVVMLGPRAPVMPAGSVIWLIAGAPVVEEVIFRLGLHQELLTRLRSAPMANAFTALAFAAAHGLSRGTPQSLLTLLPALAIGAIYQRSRRLAPAVALHAAFNTAWLMVPGLAP